MAPDGTGRRSAGSARPGPSRTSPGRTIPSSSMDRLGHLAIAPLGIGNRIGHGIVEITFGQAIADHLEREEVLTLLAQDPAQAFHVVFEELAVARRGALRVDQALALEKADLRDRDVGKLLAQQSQDIADGEIRAAGHSLPATR